MDLADKVLGSLSCLDPETSIPAQEILVSLRALHDELVATHEENARLRNELASTRKRLDHFDQVLAPKYQQHAQVSRENEFRLKQMLESERSQKSDLILEVQSLKVRLQTALGEINALKTQLSIKEDEARQLELSLQTVQAQCDSQARGRSPETIHNAVTSAVGGVKQEYEARLRTLDSALASGKKEYETQVAVLSQQLVLARKRESDIEASLNDWRSRYEQLSAAAAADRASHSGSEAIARAQRADLDAAQSANRRFTSEIQSLQSRQIELEAGLKQAASLAAARERERSALKEKALQDYILHLNHVISVLEDTIARSLRDPKFRSSPSVKGNATTLKRPNSARSAGPSNTTSGPARLSQTLPGHRHSSCSHSHRSQSSCGEKSKSLKCLADLRGFTGCCHDVKHSGCVVISSEEEPASARTHRRDRDEVAQRQQRSRSRSPNRNTFDTFNYYAGLNARDEDSVLSEKRPSSVQWAQPVVQPWIPPSGVTTISSRSQNDSVLQLPATATHAADSGDFNPNDIRYFLPRASSERGAKSSSFARDTQSEEIGNKLRIGDPSFTGLTLPASGSKEERVHFADPVRSILIRDLETELAQLTAQYTQAVSHYFGSQGRSVSRSMFESRNDDETVTAVLNVPAFKKLAKEIAKRRQTIFKLTKEANNSNFIDNEEEALRPPSDKKPSSQVEELEAKWRTESPTESKGAQQSPGKETNTQNEEITAQVESVSIN